MHLYLYLRLHLQYVYLERDLSFRSGSYHDVAGIRGIWSTSWAGDPGELMWSFRSEDQCFSLPREDAAGEFFETLHI